MFLSPGRILGHVFLALLLWLPAADAWSAELRLPEDYDTLQDAIDHAENGDTILVGDGVWRGSNNRDVDFGRKRLHIRSLNGPAHCIIDCEELGIGFLVRGGQRPGESSIAGFTIRNGHSYGLGGAIYIWHSAVRVENNIIIDCAASYGGAIFVGDNARPPIVGNIFSGNRADIGGGAINTSLENLVIQSNIFIGNRAPEGGALSLGGEHPVLHNNLLAWNEAEKGGAVFCHDGARVTVSHCTISGNTAGQGGAVFTDSSSSVAVDHSILWGNSPDELVWAGPSPAVSWSDVSGGFSGPGVINAAPLFITGPLGPFYLSQAMAGEELTSPCVDAGSPAIPPLAGTTRTDTRPDSGIVDLGFHHRFSGSPWGPPETVVEEGPRGTVTVPAVSFLWSGSDDRDSPDSLVFAVRVDEGEWTSWSADTSLRLTGLAEGPHTVGIRARDTHGNEDPTPAERTFTVDPWAPGAGWGPVAVVPGPGPVNGPVVRTAAAQWLAYGTVGHGLNIAAGDLDGDGMDELVTGPGPTPGAGPHLRGWEADGSSLPWVNFPAYGTVRWGATVACGDLDGDGVDEIVSGAGPGPGLGPHVRGWSTGGGHVSPLPGISFMGYGSLNHGVRVACGDLDGDGKDEIVTGPGPGALLGAHVRAWDTGPAGVSQMPGISFLAYTSRYGVELACGDLDGDGIDEIVTGPGPGAALGAHVRAWDASDGRGRPLSGVNFLAYSTRFGVTLACGDIDGDGVDEILTLPGPQPGATAHLRSWNFSGGAVAPADLDYVAFDAWMGYGGRAAVVNGGRR